MKAEDYFKKEYGYGHIPLVMAEEDLVSMYALIDEYSIAYTRTQIEKYRNEVKKMIRTELQDFPDMASELIFSIDNTPINLD